MGNNVTFCLIEQIYFIILVSYLSKQVLNNNRLVSYSRDERREGLFILRRLNLNGIVHIHVKRFVMLGDECLANGRP